MTLPGEGPPTTIVDLPHAGSRAVRASILIGLCCFLLYNANLRSITAGDTYPARYLPFAIIQYHTIFFAPIEKVASQGRGLGAYWMLRRPGGRIMSLYPVVLPVLVAPLYLPAVAYLHLRGWSDARLDDVAKVMEKLTASFLASLSAALLYLLLLRRARPRVAVLLTVAYALGTTTWVVSSQALWQHGLGELLIIGAMLLLTGPPSARRVVGAGLLLGLIACNRPPDVILGAALGVYGLYWAGRRLSPLFAAASGLPMMVVMFYNLSVAGNIGGGYGVIGSARFFQHDFLVGIGGLLISPTRGLLLFSPFVVFLVMAWKHLPRDRDERFLTAAITVAVVIQILVYAKTDWRSGLSWGPRYMTDLMPFLVWLLVPVVSALRGVARWCFLIAVGVSIAIEAIGAFCYSDFLDVPIYAADANTYVHDMRAAWRWENSPLVTSLKHGLAAPELTVTMQGSFDGIESGGHLTDVVIAGQPASVTGWALDGDVTPGLVAVSIDGRQTVVSGVFFDRPDVRATMKTASPAGWRIPFDTASLSPGEHALTAFARASGKIEGHYIADRTLKVLPPSRTRSPSAGVEPASTVAGRQTDLAEDSATAAARIREHQQAPGYWLTAYTKDTTFREPHPEMNTFLTALLIDLLQPVAATSGLEENLKRARLHLTSQIEAGGLVRYHGLPDAPGIGTLGCVITPDTDNTALVWRLAPAPDRARLSTALATIDKYRTRAGLYRTWLAARENYQCLDPGSDPDPADIAIQMHLLMLLADVRPAAGRALCEALRPVVDDNRIWVYYRKSPLIPILREPDLRRAGCTLELPESRMRTTIPEQQIWISVARLVAKPTSDPVMLRAILRELARDDFALIRDHPPLLYHNDLTATVPRFYWSEDAGYALWLRLYDEYGAGRSHAAG